MFPIEKWLKGLVFYRNMEVSSIFLEIPHEKTNYFSIGQSKVCNLKDYIADFCCTLSFLQSSLI